MNENTSVDITKTLNDCNSTLINCNNVQSFNEEISKLTNTEGTFDSLNNEKMLNEKKKNYSCLSNDFSIEGLNLLNLFFSLFYNFTLKVNLKSLKI